MTAAELISLLGLEPHSTEGGYFRRTYESSLRVDCGSGSRHLLTSIYYLLTKESPSGFLRRNKSDILHYHHLGAAIKYLFVAPDGMLTERILGPNLQAGETLQLLVPGGWWKASRLCAGEYALISEAVAPGFEYCDNQIATAELVQQQFPVLFYTLAPYVISSFYTVLRRFLINTCRPENDFIVNKKSNRKCRMMINKAAS